MTFIILIPELIILISLLLYGFILGGKNIKFLNNKFINTYILIISNLSILLWLIFILFLPDQIIISYSIYSNKLFVIFKIYFVFATLCFYLINFKSFTVFKSFNLLTLLLASFIIISFNYDLIYFIGFILLIASLFGFLISYKIKKEVLFNIAPIAFLSVLLLAYSKNNLIILFVLFTVTLLSYFAKNIKIHYLICSIIIPLLFFYLIKMYFILDFMFYKSCIIFGIILMVFSSFATFSKNFKENNFYYLILNYLSNIYILIGVNLSQATVLALLLILIIPLVLKNDFISNLTINMTPMSFLFIIKLIFFIIVFNYSLPIFFIVITMYIVSIINVIKNLNNFKLNLINKFLFIYVFILFILATVFFNNLIDIVKKVTY